ncbi:MAG: hypothetical protein V4597_14585 [Pseudomonadota bacterium]
MSPLALVLAALLGGAVSAPVAILTWPRRLQILAHARWTLRKVRRRARHLGRRWILALILRQDTGRHATPRGGTPIPTAAQIAATSTPLELLA